MGKGNDWFNSLPPDVQRQYKAVGDALRQFADRFVGVAPCVLCQTRISTILGVWAVEGENARLAMNVPKGKNRFCPYVLCADCFSLPDRMKRVEDLFIAMNAAGLASKQDFGR